MFTDYGGVHIMYNEDVLPLVYSMYTKKGSYALLLGSGISRSSNIPTGWEITLDLIRQSAELLDEDAIQDEQEWYKNKFGKEANYSEILDIVAKTSTEKNHLLREYFEPNETSDEEDKKPSKAHGAIAQMVKDGYIKIIITTNFDRLLEQALNDVGVTPQIIANEDQLQGAEPYVHSDCTIVKVHGDYMDMRIRNSEEELANYSNEMNQYLDRIFDEFGLIICGWSADWDVALRNCLDRCQSRRYMIYWLKKGELSVHAQTLVDNKKMTVIDIESADEFFTDFQGKIEALHEIKVKENPLSIDLLCATIKRLIPDTKNTIRLNDLIIAETKQLLVNMEDLDWQVTPDHEQIAKRMIELEALSERLIHLVCLGCYWGGNELHQSWIEMFKLLASDEILQKINYDVWLKLWFYPAQMIMYISIVSCMCSKHYNLLYIILNQINKRDRFGNTYIFADRLNIHEIITPSQCKKSFNNNYKVPLSERLFEVLEKPLLMITHSKEQYEHAFDKAEYFYAVNFWHNQKRNEQYLNNNVWAPVGRFRWKLRFSWNYEDEFSYEINMAEKWEAIKAGFFNSDFNEWGKSNDEFLAWVKTLHI